MGAGQEREPVPVPDPESLPAGRAAGIIPCCVGAENGVGYILLAEQPVYPASAWHVGGWNPLWGCADDTDVDAQHTAAREAYEEGRGAVGSITFIRELLLDNKSCCVLFRGCFLAGYGKLDQNERDWIENYHRKKCQQEPFNKFSWEVKQLKWIEVSTLKTEFLSAIAEERNFNPAILGNRIRPFLEKAFLKLDWNNGPLCLLSNGEYPFPDAVDWWSQWRKRTWVSKHEKKPDTDNREDADDHTED